MPHTLYIVGTPIGNLGDLPPRAVETLKKVKAVAAEDTRHVRKLMTHFDIGNRLVSFREQNRERAAGEILDLLREGDVALVSDAGMPCISDPGSYLVAATRSGGHEVRVVPGPSAAVAAVALSGISAPGYVFLGFLPRNRKDKMESLARAARAGLPIVVYEAPDRVKETLETAREVFGDCEAALARELTKVYEEYVPGTVSSLAAALPGEPRGEFVIIFRPAVREGAEPDPVAVRAEIERALDSGRGLKETSRMISTVFGIGGREAYELALRIKEEREIQH
ncbi:MAG: 16S rRNA (cytidine(1402)-2'-O)-methyltransferase [Deltaproteobacteria bacterium]|nr:16S rRNA (cytidine(1402)-2'-O)-methyltransferase [Deltaproteobacteria bacterium]